MEGGEPLGDGRVAGDEPDRTRIDVEPDAGALLEEPRVPLRQVRPSAHGRPVVGDEITLGRPEVGQRPASPGPERPDEALGDFADVRTIGVVVRLAFLGRLRPLWRVADGPRRAGPRQDGGTAAVTARAMKRRDRTKRLMISLPLVEHPISTGDEDSNRTEGCRSAKSYDPPTRRWDCCRSPCLITRHHGPRQSPLHVHPGGFGRRTDSSGSPPARSRGRCGGLARPRGP